MALETDEQNPREAKKLGAKFQRHDSLYGDAERVSGTGYHVSEVCFLSHSLFSCVPYIYRLYSMMNFLFGLAKDLGKNKQLCS
jgi:KUP system potassium uptake protein